MFKAIVAHDKNRLIGNGREIPWHVKEDFMHYKNTTTNHICIMGSTTFESIGKPLPNRTTIVLNYDKNYDAQGCEVVTNYLDLVNRYLDSEEEVYICGGASVYKLFLPYCDELIISLIKGDYQGNVYFPEYEHMFQVYKKEERDQFDIIYYKKI